MLGRNSVTRQADRRNEKRNCPGVNCHDNNRFDRLRFVLPWTVLACFMWGTLSEAKHMVLTQIIQTGTWGVRGRMIQCHH